MGNLYVEGPDALKLLSHLGTNSFAKFPVDRAKQFAPCSYDGYVIGDGILFHLEENRFVYVGIPPAANWIQFHAQTGGYDVKTEMDERSPSDPRVKAVGRSCYRFEIQGPNAPQILEKLNGGPVPEIKFFNMGNIQIAGRSVRALRHGMVGAPGLEVWGPYEEREEIRAAIVDAGRDFGLREVGSRAYAHQCHGIRLDSLAPSRHLHRREDEALSLMASGRQVLKPSARSAEASTPATFRTTT